MYIIGLMSGTSADGIDAALCQISGTLPQLSAHILDSITVPYPTETRARILAACQPHTSSVDTLCLLNFELADAFADVTMTLMERNNVSVDLIASHGQTVWHHVDADGRVNATLQIGEPAVIRERTKITVISNFRARDVAAGGQGAPLIGYVDWLLLRREKGWRAVQNIGGMANVTFLPPLNEPDREVLVFDIGPGNALIDAAVGLLTSGVQTYDANGEMAQRGKPDRVWLDALLSHLYFHRPPPKTTGRELFGSEMARELVEAGLARGLSPDDIIATLTALTVESITSAYARFAPAPIEDVVIGGGGQHNPFMMEGLLRILEVPVLRHEAFGVNSDHKEALAFALLAYETWHNRPGTLPSQTGARHPVVLGQITPGDNFERLIRETWR
jgi:anhydro-N-acetylmuramic acid kinase